MFSKSTPKVLLQVFVAINLLATVSCTKFLDEKREKPQTIEMSNARFTCLQALPEEFKRFLKAEVTEYDIQNGFTCAKGALEYFKNKTKGSYQDAYTIEDLRNFFGKYFLKKNNVTPEFGQELFKLKRVVIGGSDKFITKTEIQRLIELLDVIRDESIKMAPHMPTLLMSDVTPSWDQVDQATLQMNESLWKLFRQVDIVKSNYTFEDLKSFMAGLDQFLNGGEGLFQTQKMGSNVVLIEALKNVLIGERNNLGDIHDWQLAVDTVIGVYREGLRYTYFIKENNNGRLIQQALSRMAQDSLSILETSLPIQRQGALSFASIDKLLEVLGDRKLLPMELSPQALQETYKKIVLRILDPQRRGDARGLGGIGRNHLAALKYELKIFEAHQDFINSLQFDDGGNIGFDELQSQMQGFKANDLNVKNYSKDSLEREGIHHAWMEGMALLVNEHPVFFNQQGRQVVIGSPMAYRQSWASLTRWNVMRALSRALLLGYGNTHNSVLSQEYMLQSGLEQWYLDFNKLGVELKAFDPRSENAGSRSFKEANFFTSVGNGDQHMNHRETFDFVSLLISGGMQSADDIRREMVNASCGLNAKDIFGYPWMNEACFKKTLRKNFSNYFNNLPGMVLEVAHMDDNAWNGFYENLMSAARVSSPNGGRVEAADLRTAVMMIHYTESLMSVYDTNHDAKLNADEIRRAAPRFLEFMKSVSPVKANFMVTDFFLFLVYKGKKPTTWEYTKFQAEKAFGSLDDVGRDKILRVFKVLKDEAAKK